MRVRGGSGFACACHAAKRSAGGCLFEPRYGSERVDGAARDAMSRLLSRHYNEQQDSISLQVRVCSLRVCRGCPPPPPPPPAARCSCSPTSLSPRGNLVVNQEVASRSASKASGCQEMLARLTSCASHVYMYEDPALQVGLCRASGRPCEAVVISGSRWCCCCCSVVLLHAQLEALGVIPLASLLKAAKDNASPKARWRGSHPPDSVTPWCSADASSLCATAADVWTGAAVPAAALVPR
jgi:hypothetical protein